MYRTSYNVSPSMYRGSQQTTPTTSTAGGYYDERGFWIPFVVGGLAGGALGYGVANNNFLSNNSGPNYGGPRPCCGPYPVYYPGMAPYPYY